ncbi:MAG: imelysin family protein [Elainellaceae cyanobacterium]
MLKPIARLHPTAWIGRGYFEPLAHNRFRNATYRVLLGTALAWATAGGAIAQPVSEPTRPESTSPELTSPELTSPELSSPERATQERAVAQNTLPASPTAMMQAFNQRFPSDVVIPTYVSLTEQTARLAEASQQFAADPTEETLETLRAVWVDATTAWARGQAFAFGPIHSLGYSTALEFPADGASIEALLSDPTVLEAGNIDAIVEAIALTPSVHGFEAIAYVLYGLDGDKRLDEFSAVERLYLTRLAEMADENAQALLQVWQEGWEGYAPYETVLATAGQPGNGAYLSVEAGTEEVIRGLYNHLDVIVNEALPEMLEVWEAESILPDAIALEHLHSSVSGVRIAYTGIVDGAAADSSSGLSHLVAMENRVIDQYIQQSLDAALTNLEAAIANPEDQAALSEAHGSLTIVYDYLETEVLALVQGS